MFITLVVIMVAVLLVASSMKNIRWK